MAPPRIIPLTPRQLAAYNIAMARMARERGYLELAHSYALQAEDALQARTTDGWRRRPEDTSHARKAAS